MKIKFNSDGNLPLNKMLKLHNLTIVVRSVFQEDNKYYPQIFLDGQYERIDISEGIDINKSAKSKTCIICH